LLVESTGISEPLPRYLEVRRLLLIGRLDEAELRSPSSTRALPARIEGRP
jgi:hypothetical protein